MDSTLFRKVIATAAALSIVLSIAGPVVGVRAADSAIEAANRLASLGVIVDNSSDPSKYRLSSNITRREMLKIMMNLSSYEVGTTCEGKFSDLPASDWGCKYAESALKAGFIAPNKKFRPNDLVTEAEALKMIMKARGLSKKEGIADWGEAYRQAAIEAGILPANTTVSTKPAKRSFVIVTADSAVTQTTNKTADGTTSEEDDLGKLFEDLFDDGGTDMTGTGEDKSAGTSTGVSDTDNKDTSISSDLEVSLNPSSPAEGSSIPQKGIIRFATVDFTAGKSDVSINSVEVKKAGLFTVSTQTKAWFELNGRRVSGRSSFTSEGNVILSFAPALVVKAGSTQSVDLIVELDGSSSTDYRFAFGDINSSASKVSGSLITPTLRTSNYIVAGFSYTGASAGSTYNVMGEEVYELGAFKIAHYKTGSITETRDLDFKSITLYQSESADLNNLKDLVLVRDGNVVSTQTIITGKAVTFSVKDTIKDGASPIYYVKAKIANVENNEDYYQFYVKKSSDIVIYEVASGVRTSANNPGGQELVYANKYTIKGSDVSFSRDDTVSLSATYAPGTPNVVLMQGYIEAKQAVNLENPVLKLTITGGNGFAMSDYFNTVYMSIGNTSLSASADTGTLTGSTVKTLTFDGTATISGKVLVKVYVNLKSTTGLPNSTSFKLEDLDLSKFTGSKEYVSNGNSVTSYIGSIPSITVTVGQSTLNVTRNDGLGDTTIATGKKGVKVLGVNFSSTQGNPIRVSSLIFEFTGSGTSTGYINKATATLYVDGVSVKSKSINATSVKFDGFNFDVTTSKSVNVELKVDFTDAFTDDKFTASLTGGTAIDTVSSTDLSSQIIGLTGPTFTVVNASATLALSSDTPKRLLVTAGSNGVKLLTFRITAKNDDINLKKITFSGSKLDSFNNFALKDSSGKLVYASSASGTAVVFDNISANTFVAAQDSTIDLSLYADAKTNTNTGTTYVGINGNEGLVIRGTNGLEIVLTGTSLSSISSKGADVYENTARITQVQPVSKNIASDAMRFSISASGKNSVTLSGVTLTGTLSGYTGSYTVEVRKVSDDTLVASGSSLSTISFFPNTTVDAGKTETYYIKLAGIAVDSQVQQSDWTIRLTNLTVRPVTDNPNIEVDLADYPQNNDTLPLTSSK